MEDIIIEIDNIHNFAKRKQNVVRNLHARNRRSKNVKNLIHLSNIGFQ